MGKQFYMLWVACLVAACAGGCKRGEKFETVQGANERVAALERDKASLQDEVKRKDRELKETKEMVGKDAEQRIVRLQELHAQREADLLQRLASLQLNLTTVTQERIVLQEVVDRREKAPAELKARFDQERMVWITLLVVCMLPTLYLAARYWVLRHGAASGLVRRAGAAAGFAE